MASSGSSSVRVMVVRMGRIVALERAFVNEPSGTDTRFGGKVIQVIREL